MFVQGICYNNDKLGIIMSTRHGSPSYVQILSASTYASLFSTTMSGPLGYNTRSISSLGSSDWLLKDPNSCLVFHIIDTSCNNRL